MKTQMFRNYDEIESNCIPNNTIPVKRHTGIKDIIRGTTPEHFLTLPFDVTKDVEKLTVTYKQGITVCVKKHLNTVSYDTKRPKVIFYQFTEEETNRFKAYPNTPIKVQVKVLLKSGDVYASDIYFIKCLDILDHDPMDETPHTRVGDVEIVDWETEELMYVIPYDSEMFD